MKKHTILLVDDEPMVIRLLEMTFADQDYGLLTASSGAEALTLLASHEVSLVLSDNKMAEMTGIELLREVSERWPDCARLLLTGFAEAEIVMAAINDGRVHRFITKPWDPDQLLRVVKEALERSDLKAENRRLLELTRAQNEELRTLNTDLDRRVNERTRELSLKHIELEMLYGRVKRSVLDTVKMFSSLLETYDETLGGHSTRVAALSRDLAAQVGLTEEQIEEIEIAARLHDVGMLCLPRDIARVNEQSLGQLNEQGKALFRRHPEYGQGIVASNERFVEVGRIIRAHHERYDGLGYPDRLKGETIPLGARIIAIAGQYDRIAVQAGQKNSWGNLHERQQEEAIQYLRVQRGKAFDPHLTLLFLKVLGEKVDKNDWIIEVPLEHLRVGMTLAGGISSGTGLFIIGPGVTLQSFHLARLESFNRIDPITQKIFVRDETKIQLAEAGRL